MRLDGKTAIVTGAGRNIGQGIALALAREGAAVAIADYDAQAAGATAQLIREAGGRAITVEVDVTDKPQVQLMVDHVMEAWGRIDVLVNNVGILAICPVIDMAEETWDRVMTINTKGVFLCSQAVLPIMIAQGGGRIINMSSQAGKEGSALSSAYAASKHAIIGFTQSLAKEVGEHHITVNALCPGSIDTEMLANEYFPLKANLTGQDTESYARAFINRIPLKRMGRIEEIGFAAVFLASDEADYVTGIALAVAGGSMVH
jgi:meso-butanediol dehydrogenase / (S,S)-butanediol dehydrogenase / diacetyl reductase